MTRAVLLDALGTLVGLAPPAPLLREQLAARGCMVTEAQAAAAMRAEMACYRAEHHRAADAAGLAAVRADCTAVLDAALPEHARGLPDLETALLQSLRFSAFPEVAGVLAELRARGLRLVVCSNWDVSLHDVLHATGLRPLLDGVVTSAEAGVAKPAGAIFAAALQAAGGIDPGQALHAGDDLEADVAGARASGIAPVLVARDGQVAPPGTTTVDSLTGLVPLAV
jgi:putative hydrolase of the HAD superfamily